MISKTCGDISGARWARFRAGANTRHYIFDLTIQQGWELYLQQNHCCKLTGVNIEFQDRTASLDRIDSNKGYLLDNVQWVHKYVNYIKRNMGESELLDWCRAIQISENKKFPSLIYNEHTNEEIELMSYAICKGKGRPYEIGQEYGLLKIERFWLEKSKNKKWRETYCECRCQCGNSIIIKGDYLRSKRRKSCGCLNLHKQNSNRWKGYGEIPRTYWSWLINGADKRKIAFDISIEQAWDIFVQQGGKCALSGAEISFGIKKQYTASLDRIDSNQDYILGNVQWVHKQVNLMKWKLGQQEFIDWCKRIVEFSCTRKVVVGE
jgi:hypothetical protein